MKKILAIVAAALMALTLAGCDAPEKHDYEKDEEDLQKFVDEGEYKDEVIDLVSDFIEANKKYFSDLESVDEADAIELTNKYLKKTKNYLSDLEELNPPSGEKSFHKELKRLVQYAELYNKTIEDYWENYDNRLIADEAANQMTEVADDFEGQLEDMANSTDWFKKGMKAKGHIS